MSCMYIPYVGKGGRMASLLVPRTNIMLNVSLARHIQCGEW